MKLETTIPMNATETPPDPTPPSPNSQRLRRGSPIAIIVLSNVILWSFIVRAVPDRGPGARAGPRIYQLAAALSALLAAATGWTLDLVDVTDRTGIEFRHRSGSESKDWIAEVNGSGVALFDYDRDGDLDVYVVNCGADPLEPGDPSGRNALYRNDGAWRFRDVTADTGLGDLGWGTGATVADIDNDGWLDVYVTNLGPNALYRNFEGRFEKVIASGTEDPAWSASASFADFDRDGVVDLYVTNYVKFRADPGKKRGSGACSYKSQEIFCGPGGLEASPDSLFINRGGGRFIDASMAWGVRAPEPCYGLGTLIVDVDSNGFPDVVVANDTHRNLCFVNDRGRGFVEAGVFLGLAYNDYGVEQAGMGLAAGDVRGVGREDIFVTNFEDDTNTLYLAEEGVDGRRTYREGTFPAGLGTPSYRYLGWGCFFFDVEGDGDLDLFVANGHVAPQADSIRSSAGYRQPNQLFRNDGKGRFREDEEFRSAERAAPRCSRGAAHGDLDGDGDPDVVVSNIDDRPSIYENRSDSTGKRWLRVDVEGRRSNRAAIGARVEVTAGGRKAIRNVRAGESFASTCERVPTFALEAGLPAAIRVEWPSGLVEIFSAPAGVRYVRAVEGSGRSADRR
jgi:hypothetical protein